MSSAGEHIIKEQDGLFPAAPASPGPEQWEAVDPVRARVGGTRQGGAGSGVPGCSTGDGGVHAQNC
ncbi:hypothetical protein GCM10010359_49190 [Streptomyces morookaense]|nr:hypothetical protein GCM10010359_49190 [Streptomyces morookaense]